MMSNDKEGPVSILRSQHIERRSDATAGHLKMMRARWKRSHVISLGCCLLLIFCSLSISPVQAFKVPSNRPLIDCVANTPTIMPTPTETPAITPTPTEVPTATPTPTTTVTPTPIPTETPTGTPAPTPIPTETPTGTPTPTPTVAPTTTPTPSSLPTQPGKQYLTANSSNLRFTTPAGTTATQTLAITNTGKEALDWSAITQTMDKRDWLSADPRNATLKAGEGVMLNVSVNTLELAEGSYGGVVIISSPSGKLAIIILLTVSPKLALSAPVASNTFVDTSSSNALFSYAMPDEPVAVPTLDPCSTDTSKTGCTIDSPYGITTINADEALVAAYKQLGICWVRYQVSVKKIETSPGVYDWTQLDKAVATMNKAGIHIDFPLRCFIGSCFSSPQLPTTQHMAQFAEAIATRYDGKHGHGIIDAFEIGNEEYDFFPIGVYGPLLKAGYEAIKKANPNAKVGMYGPFKPSLSHMQNVFQYLKDYSQNFDFANFHYYVRGHDPRGPGNNMPSYKEVYETIHSLFPEKLIWVTEIGWPTKDVSCCKAVTPQQQADYLRYIMTESAQSGVIEKVFWFTLNYGSQGDTIYPPEGPLPAFFTYQSIVKEMPLWKKSTDPTPTPTEVVEPTPTPTLVPTPTEVVEPTPTPVPVTPTPSS